jgi:zinc transport system permease protein
MLTVLTEIFSYAFLVRAMVVGLFVSLCVALLGVSLVLKRFSMIGDGLAQVSFASLVIAAALNAAPLVFSLPVVLLAAFVLFRLSEKTGMSGDSAIALTASGALALGVVVIYLTTGVNMDATNYMFGSILNMTHADARLSISLAVLILLAFTFFYHRIFAVTFDAPFAGATGLNVRFYHLLTAMLTALTITLGMRMMGVLLISGLVVFPALTAMRLCRSFLSVTVVAGLISVTCYFGGVVISYVYATPAGASITLLNLAVFLVFSGTVFVKRRILP